MNKAGKLEVLLEKLSAKTVKIQGSHVMTSEYHYSNIGQTIYNNLDLEYYSVKNMSMFKDAEDFEFGNRADEKCIDAAIEIFKIVEALGCKTITVKLNDDNKIISTEIEY